MMSTKTDVDPNGHVWVSAPAGMGNRMELCKRCGLRRPVYHSMGQAGAAPGCMGAASHVTRIDHDYDPI